MLASSSIPFSATPCLLTPSKAKGSVTTATVSTPSSRAILATTGIAPVPVPPPMPAVKNSISALPIASIILSLLSSAAARPTEGSAPAPNPLVRLLPSSITFSESYLASACKSVLMTLNSTPRIFAAIICSSALQPPPPTPNTFISAPRSSVGSGSGSS